MREGEGGKEGRREGERYVGIEVGSKLIPLPLSFRRRYEVGGCLQSS